MTSPRMRDKLAMHRLAVMRRRQAQAEHRKNCPTCSAGGPIALLQSIFGAIEPEPELHPAPADTTHKH